MANLSEQAPFIMLDESGAPLYRQIYEAIRRFILSGEFAPGRRLPSSRALAAELKVSRITVVNAYEQLFAEGYLEGKTGSGTFVGAELPDDLLETGARKRAVPARSASSPLRLSQFGEQLAAKSLSAVRGQIIATFQPFQNGLTAVEEFPFDTWARLAARWQRNPTRQLLGYGDPQGYKPLRQAIAAHLASARGVNAVPEQIVITSGAQQALDLTARIFITPGDTVLTEDPCYQEARGAFEAAGANIIPVPVDSEGIDITRAPAGGARPKFVYVTPSHQYPLGVTMSLPRRLALIEWARSRDAWIIEDDYNSEFRYAGRPLASLQGLDPAGRVIYVGTFSKTIFPSLRLGCLVLPEELVDVFAAARALNDVHSSLIDQAVLAEFIAEGHFARHVRRMRTLYELRQRILLEECRKQLGGLLEVEKADAGMHLVGWLPEGVSDVELSKKAAERGLKLSAVSEYYQVKPVRGGFILGYTAFDERQIKEGVKIIKEVLSGKAAIDPTPR
jgi:GntR family transcriptional regulator/MocR family aminotransferase